MRDRAGAGSPGPPGASPRPGHFCPGAPAAVSARAKVARVTPLSPSRRPLSGRRGRKWRRGRRNRPRGSRRVGAWAETALAAAAPHPVLVSALDAGAWPIWAPIESRSAPADATPRSRVRGAPGRCWRSVGGWWHAAPPAVKQRPQFPGVRAGSPALLDSRRPVMQLALISGPLRVPEDGPTGTLERPRRRGAREFGPGGALISHAHPRTPHSERLKGRHATQRAHIARFRRTDDPTPVDVRGAPRATPPTPRVTTSQPRPPTPGCPLRPRICGHADRGNATVAR